MLSRSQLFERLAEGHAAGITVVTPNRRLAHALTLDFDAFQGEKKSWDAPDILPIGAFIARLWEEVLYSDAGKSLPLLLSDSQEQHLWERILDKSGLLVVPQAAAQCREAWKLMHAWRIPMQPGNEDVEAFYRWAEAYQKETRHDTDAARLPDLLAQYKVPRPPKLVVAYGFDVMPPQTKEFLARFTLEESGPEPTEGTSLRSAFPSGKQEIEAAASWARARLEEGKARIGVVVPDLGRRRAEVVRVFSRVMGTPLPFNVSLGRPLSTYPLVHAALTLLRLSFHSVEFSEASWLLRSPFLGGADTEMARRATLDARIRRDADATISLAKLIAASEQLPILRKRLEAVFEEAKKKPTTPAEWARTFSSLLDAAGFPGERVLDSEEFQTRAKLHDALGELSRLERFAEKMSFGQAHAMLSRQCADTLFQPESADAPIQVLGLLESDGLRFDCLWVSGLTDEAWPLAARPNPFIPAALQRKAGIPQATAEASLTSARRFTAGWQQAASEVVFSHATKEEDRDLAASPLISSIPQGTPAAASYPRFRDLVFEKRQIETFEDWQAPPAQPGKVRGGTRVLADQAACPFRAFAKWRLGAEVLEEPVPGLDPRDRGKLLHALMREIWTRVRSSANLQNDLTLVIEQSAAVAVKEMGLEGRFAELERVRLAKLANEWLDVERRRAPFEVSSLEEQRDLNVAGLQMQSRIDRMDKVEGGGHALIDYKTGMVNTRAWEGPRPDDPQMPLYAIAAPEVLSAVVFAKLKTGEMRFMGHASAPNLMPKVEKHEDWQRMVAQWKQTVEELGKSYLRGDANVDPKDDLKTCRRCDLQTLCRVYEKL